MAGMSRDSYHHGDLAQALERAAMELLEEMPAEQISLREVARRTGVSHSAPLHHFGNRRGLLNALVRKSLELLIVELEAAINTQHDPRSRALALGRAYLHYALAHPHAFNAIYDPTICVPNDPTPENAPLLGRLDEIVAEVSASVVPDAAPTEREVAGVALWSGVHGAALLASTGHISGDSASAAIELLLGCRSNT